MPLRDAGRGSGIITGSTSVADQTINAGTTAKIIDSDLTVNPGHFPGGVVLRWEIVLSKTAAGTAANSFLVKVGLAGLNTDPTILTFALPVGTAVIDTGVIAIIVTVRGATRSASGLLQGTLILQHNLAATGLSTIPCVVLKALSPSVDLSREFLIATLSCTTAALTVLTFHQVIASSDENA